MKKTIILKQGMKVASAFSAVLIAASLAAVPAFADVTSDGSEIRELKEVANIPDDVYEELMAASPSAASENAEQHLSIHVTEDGKQVIARSASDTAFACDFTQYKFSQTERRAKENDTSTYVNVTWKKDDPATWAFRVLGNTRFNNFVNRTYKTNAYCNKLGEALIYQTVWEGFHSTTTLAETPDSTNDVTCQAMLQTIRTEAKGGVSGWWSPDSVNTRGMTVLNP